MSAFQQVWRCVLCTFDNLPSSNQCEICDTAKPVINKPQTPDPMDLDFEYAKQLHAQFNAEIQQSNDVIDADLEYAKRLQAQFNKDDNQSHQQPQQQITNKNKINTNKINTTTRKLSRNTSTYWNITGRKTNNSRKRMLENSDSHSISPPPKQRKIISDLEFAKNLQAKFDTEIGNANKKIKHKKPKKYFGKNKKPVESTSFPKILPNNYRGDPNIALNILNEWKGLQHDEFKEYNSNIPQLKVELKDYQKRGVSWMLNMEENGNKFSDGVNGGLLCDEMGLGKTVQTIALMLIQKAKMQQIGKKDRTIIITPMSLIDQWISELNHICDGTAFKIVNYYGNERALLRKHDFESCDVVLSTVQTFCNVTNFQAIGKLKKEFFSRMVIDEMHEVGNGVRTRFYTQFCESKGIKYRWALTGTPINNDLPVDLSGMCRFIGIKYNIYCKQLSLLKKHKMNLKDESCVNKVKEFMGPIMLRRTKNQVLANNFPEKREEIIRFDLNEEEQIVYDRFAAEIQEKYLNTRSYVIIHSLLLKLRKLCNHPSLVFSADRIINDFNKNVGLNEDVLERISFGIIRRINSMESILNNECPVCFEITELNGGIISNCGHLFCLECLNECVQQKGECALCRGVCDENDIINIQNVLNSKYINEKHKYEFNQWREENQNIIKNLGNGIVDKVCVFDQHQKYQRLVQKYSQISMASTKINSLIEKLKYIQMHHKGDKVIIFSNFSQSFNVISERLERENIKHLQFHSKLRRGQRKEVLNEFKNKKKGFFGNKNVLLISAKCASVGLNLMCANHVIFLDARWNPALDNQAIGRCWRLGQNKTVYVTRLITNDTIEEKILSLMQDKNEKKYKNMTNLKRKAKLTERDYDMLFGYDRSDNTNNR